MKKIIVFTLILASLFSLSFAENAKQAKVINVQVGHDFTITLEANATTGYQWQFAKPLDKSSFKLISSSYLAEQTNRVGSGGRQIWVLKALKAGKANISFKYVRSWEKHTPAVKEESFLVDITN